MITEDSFDRLVSKRFFSLLELLTINSVGEFECFPLAALLVTVSHCCGSSCHLRLR